MCIGCFVLSYLSCFTLSHLMLHCVLEPRVSLEAASLSLGVEVRCAYIPPSPDPTNSFAVCGILLGMID
ncbi:hypothetical protein Hanom_Chr06g00570951 [Helianthus anomalus]